MNAHHDVNEYAEHKHWSAMSRDEKIDCLGHLRYLVRGIDPERLNMNSYVSGNRDFIKTLDVNKELTDQEYYACGTAFCILGWVAPIERFAVAFNVKPELFTNHYPDFEYDAKGEVGVTLNPEADDTLLPWTAFDELLNLFHSETNCAAGTQEQKEEVLLRLDTAIANLKGI